MRKLFNIILLLLVTSPAVCQDGNSTVNLKAYKATRVIADSLVTIGNWKGAIEAHTLALQYKPNDSISLKVRGISFSASKQYVKAYEDFDSLIRLNDKNADAYFLRALAVINLESEDIPYDERYTHEAACRDMKKAKELGFRFNNEYLFAQMCPDL